MATLIEAIRNHKQSIEMKQLVLDCHLTTIAKIIDIFESGSEMATLKIATETKVQVINLFDGLMDKLSCSQENIEQYTYEVLAGHWLEEAMTALDLTNERDEQTQKLIDYIVSVPEKANSIIEMVSPPGQLAKDIVDTLKNTKSKHDVFNKVYEKAIASCV